jgi:signal transduction histidine kinase
MENLLNDLLTYSRAGRVLQAPEMIDTRLLINCAVELLNLPSSFNVQVLEPMPTLFTERVPLETVFRNLIDNAYKHHHRPEQGSVTVTAEDLGSVVLFAMSDNGPGIAPEYHARVFEMFQKLKSRDEVEGSGIGLSVVKKTIESRGGSIELDSTPGTGTTIRFTWPKQAPAEDSPLPPA